MLLPFSIRTPAKINTILYILGKRKDGLHDIYSHLVPISVYDKLTFDDSPEEGIRVRVKGSKIPGSIENNLVLKAARAFHGAVGRRLNIDILLEKKIPFGAGLGGGSGNAAGTLHGLNHMCGHPLDVNQLHKLASSLGSDIPFFLNPQPQEARGTGSRLRKLGDYPLSPLLVLMPDFQVSTADAYRHCRAAPMGDIPNIGTRRELAENIFNGFENTLFRSYPKLRELKKMLLDNGAISASVSGSGSAVFGLFETDLQQKKATQHFQSIKSIKSIRVIVCAMLKRHHYFTQ